ncbi:hypothetical protein ACLOJK_012232 [Asimina triloba]
MTAQINPFSCNHIFRSRPASFTSHIRRGRAHGECPSDFSRSCEAIYLNYANLSSTGGDLHRTQSCRTSHLRRVLSSARNDKEPPTTAFTNLGRRPPILACTRSIRVDPDACCACCPTSNCLTHSPLNNLVTCSSLLHTTTGPSPASSNWPTCSRPDLATSEPLWDCISRFNVEARKISVGTLRQANIAIAASTGAGEVLLSGTKTTPLTIVETEELDIEVSRLTEDYCQLKDDIKKKIKDGQLMNITQDGFFVTQQRNYALHIGNSQTKRMKQGVPYGFTNDDATLSTVVSFLTQISTAQPIYLSSSCDDAECVSLAKQDLERALVEAMTEAGYADHAREEASRLSSKLDAVRTERDEAVGRAAATREEVLQFSTELVALRSEVEALHVCGTDPGTNEESSRAELEAVRKELLAEYKTMRVEVARLQTKLETSRAERLQAVSPQGGDALTLGSISSSTCASVIAEYFQRNVHQRREEFERSHYSQSRTVRLVCGRDRDKLV